jgi:hypothetical protein
MNRYERRAAGRRRRTESDEVRLAVEHLVDAGLLHPVEWAADIDEPTTFKFTPLGIALMEREADA